MAKKKKAEHHPNIWGTLAFFLLLIGILVYVGIEILPNAFPNPGRPEAIRPIDPCFGLLVLGIILFVAYFLLVELPRWIFEKQGEKDEDEA